MNWRKLLGLEKQPDKKVPEQVFKIDPKCPYCDYEFSEMPKRKRKCPECKKVIHRKYYPGEKTKRLVTEQEAAKIDQAWEQHYINEEIEQIGRVRYNEFRLPLVNEGKNPSHADVLINMYSWEYKNALHNHSINEYSWKIGKLADTYYMNEDYFNSLKSYLECCFISSNGLYRNNEFREFGRKLPPGVINPMIDCIKKLNITESEVHKLFTGLTTTIHHELETPFHPQDIWHDQLKKLLFP